MSIKNSPTRAVTFVIPVNDDVVFKKNFLSSPVLKGEHLHEIIVQRGFSSAAQAYNSAFAKAKNDLIIFVHQDVFLPENWLLRLEESIDYLERQAINWGVLGCYGLRTEDDKPMGIGRVYTHGVGIHGIDIDKPEPVQTLDEIILIIRKSSGLRFDPSLPHFHMYGTDICMTAREKEMPSYVIPAFCIHNTNQIIKFPREFYECYRYIKRRWRKYLPIYTSCIKISSFDSEIHLRRLRSICSNLFHKSRQRINRTADPESILERLITGEIK
jgi:Glycosyltransferase like family